MDSPQELGNWIWAGIALITVLWGIVKYLAHRQQKQQDDTIKDHDLKINDLRERTKVIEETVVKNKEFEKRLEQFRKDTNRDFDKVNRNIEKTRDEIKDNLSEFKKENKDLIDTLTKLYAKEHPTD